MNAKYDKIINLPRSHKESFRLAYSMLFCDMNRLESFLSSGMKREDIVSVIEYCAAIKEHEEKNRPHKKSPDQSKTVKPYTLFMQMSMGSIALSEKNFNDVYHALSGICLDDSELMTDQKSRSAASALLSLGIDRSECIACLFEMFITHSPESIWLNHASEGADPMQLNDASDSLRKLGNISSRYLDALCLLSCDPMSNDIQIENSLCYYSFTSRLRTKSGVIHSAALIEPTPYFIRKWASDSFVHDVPVHMYISEPYTVMLLRSILGDRSSIHIQNIEELSGDIKESPSDTVLMFGNHIFDHEVKGRLVDDICSHVRSEHLLMILDNDHDLSSPRSALHKALRQTRIRRIDLLPDSIHYCTRPKRKMLISATHGYLNSREQNVHVTSLKLISRSSCQIISSKCSELYIPKEQLEQGSIRKLFSEAEYENLLKTDKRRKKKQSFVFSDEIMFTYSLSEKNARPVINTNAYIISPDGRRFSLPAISVEKAPLDDTDPESYLRNTYAYKTIRIQDGSKISVRAAISEKLKELYKGSPITLRTFIYVNQSIEQDYSEDEDRASKDLLNSPIAEMYPRTISAEHLSSFILSYPGNKTAMFHVLKGIFALALLGGHVAYDPILYMSSTADERFDELDQLRSVLTKQFLSLEEAQSISRSCIMHAEKDPSYLAVLFRLFSGVEPSLLCAIQYKDFHRTCHKGESFTILSLERRLSAGTQAFSPLQRKENVRDIPVPEVLSSLIEKRKDSVRRKYPEITEEQLLAMPVFSGKGIAIDASVSVISPSKISYTSRRLINKLDIEEDLLMLPDNRHGIKKTDLNSYSGDILRNTFRHYLVRETPLISSEIRYILGMTATDIDYQNYVDCGIRNTEKQYRMYKAIEKVSHLMFKEDR